MINEAKRTCEACRHFDKQAFPDNKEFGKCVVDLPPLPIWMTYDTTIYDHTHDKYRAVARITIGCQLFSKEPFRNIDANGHKQVLTQVWAEIDIGIAEHVTNLSEMIGVLTHSSCEGDFGEGAYVMVTWKDVDARACIAAEYDLIQEGDNWGYALPRKSK